MPVVPLTPELEETHLEAVHVATMKMANAMEDRDKAITQAYLDGVSPSKIAAATEGMTRQRVWQIATQ
jgi:hypothetical protein